LTKTAAGVAKVDPKLKAALNKDKAKTDPPRKSVGRKSVGRKSDVKKEGAEDDDEYEYYSDEDFDD
jgi:hypothetical protein